MADVDPALLAEAQRRGLVPGAGSTASTSTPAQPRTPNPDLVAEAQRRGLIPAAPAPMSPSQQRAYDYERSTAVDPRVGMFNQGVALGWSDEADALVEQGLTAASNLGRRLTNQPQPFSAQEAHDAALRVNREMEAQQRERDPNVLGMDPYEIAGTVAAPWGAVNRALKGARIASPALRALLLGAGAGGASAAGTTTGDAGQRAAAVPGGAAMGAVTGGALHGAGRLLSSSPVRQAGNTLVRTLGRALGQEWGEPENVGRRVVSEMMHRADPTGQRLGANPAEARGAPITSAEAGGRETMTHLRAVGRRSGQTPEALDAMLQDRAVETPHRIVDDFSQITGINPAEVEGNFAQQADRLRTANRPLYDRAYGFQGPVISDELTSLSRTPAVRAAMRRAMTIAGNERVPANEVGITIGPTGQETITNPTMRTWDLIKRGLDRELEQYRDPVTRRLNLSGEGGDVLKVLNEVRSALTDSRQPWGPNYQSALDAGGEPRRLETAYHDATRLMNNSTPMRDFDTRWQALSSAEQEAFRSGIVRDVSRRAMAGTTRLRDITSRAYETKLRRVFGDERGGQLIARIRDEQQMLTHGRQMQPGIGTQTAETQMADQEVQANLRAAGNVLRHAGEGRWGAALLHGVGHVFDRLIHDGEINSDRATRDVIGRLLMMPPSELHADLRAFAEASGRDTPTDTMIRNWIERMSVAAKSTAAASAGRNTVPAYPSRALNQALATGP